MEFSNVDVNKAFTWKKYTEGMCDDCWAGCCKLTLEVDIHDLVTMGVIDEFDLGEDIRKVAKRLKKQGIVRLFNLKREIFTIAQRENKDCIFLDEETRKCTIYNNMPKACKDNPEKVGSRIGYCPYKNKSLIDMI